MPEENTARVPIDAVSDVIESDDPSQWPSCPGCGMHNPSHRRSCLACGAPIVGREHVFGPLPVDTPLLERDAEIDRLDQLLGAFVQDGTGGFVLVKALEGVGATRMLRHAAERLFACPPTRILATTVRDGDMPFAPVTRLLWERFGVTPSRGPQTVRDEIIAEVQRVVTFQPGAPPAEHARRIVITAGVTEEESGRWEADVQKLVPRLAESVSRFFRADAVAQPVALLIDHLERASDEGFNLLREMIPLLGKHNVLVLAVCNAAKCAEIEKLATSVIELAPLTLHARTALCAHLLPGIDRLPDALMEAVMTRSEGLPARLRSILHGLIEAGVIRVDEVPWRVDLDALGPNGPVSNVDLIQIRLSRLDAEARSMLERAAVVGEVFWEGAVVSMARCEGEGGGALDEDGVPTRVDAALRILTAAELVAPIEDSELAFEREYTFTMPGLRDYLWRTQGEAARRKRHDVCASWLELAAGPRADDLAWAIASHLERAGLPDAAGVAYLRAARAARASYRGPLAVQLFEKALQYLAPGDAPTRLQALHDKGVVLSLLGRVDEADQTFRAMLELAHRYGARTKVAAALGRLGRLARERGELAQAEVILTRALEMFRFAEDVRGVAAVHDDLGKLAYLGGRFDEAVSHCTRALELRREMHDPLGEALSTHNLGLVHHARGQSRQARAHFERALALREKHGDVEGSVLTRNALAVLALEAGEHDQAEQIWRDIIQMAEALGDRRMIAYVTHNLGEAAVLRGDAVEARPLLDHAQRVAMDIGDRRVLGEVERTRGTMARDEGDPERARTHLEAALELARTSGGREAEALALRGLGQVSAMTMLDVSGESAQQAETYFLQAVALLEELGAMRELARTRAVLGRYLVERGETLHARKVLTLAVPVLERLEMAEAAESRRALAEIGGPWAFADVV